MSNHRPRGDLKDWLTSKLEDQLDDGPPTPATTRQLPAATRRPGTGPGGGSLDARLGQIQPPDDEDVEDAPTTVLRSFITEHDEEEAADPETVQASDFSLEEHDDPRTVRIHRMPVSFIGESVIDPATVRLDGEEVSRWRAEAPVDEVPLLPRATPTPPAPKPARAPEAAASAEQPAAEGRDWVGLFATAVAGGAIGLLVVALWAWLIR